MLTCGYTFEHKQQACIARDESYVVYRQPVGHSWQQDPFAQGSYSYIAAGQEKIFTEQSSYGGEPVRTLFKPAGNLFFAGEHTTVLMNILGTMEAAIESGERIARIIKSIRALVLLTGEIFGENGYILQASSYNAPTLSVRYNYLKRSQSHSNHTIQRGPKKHSRNI